MMGEIRSEVGCKFVTPYCCPCSRARNRGRILDLKVEFSRVVIFYVVKTEPCMGNWELGIIPDVLLTPFTAT